ncbi:phosphinothricin acetyltransferase [Salirhabdus euzebyi]|uniref:Phosphinothricin acetyltransferase n=1 Tax=Salirhabdus euzebyi TaxID=394506 RepID=A0A841Q8R7_9BACI|nr:GNAT family N-acetyltransferase [Salirhabdus euzebyi]MBB6454800.1 phosphinothricin acetyltransferase [Salirhabdus euzebyi]
MKIRKCSQDDLPKIRSIMNHYINHSTTIFDLEPKTEEDLNTWYSNYKNTVYPLIVAEVEGEVVGYAYLSPYRPKAAYSKTVELSVYTSPDYQGKGLGSKLMKAILQEGMEQEFHTVLSFITTENQNSIAFHEKFGFEFVGNLKQVGYKMDKWLDVNIYQLILGEN